MVFKMQALIFVLLLNIGMLLPTAMKKTFLILCIEKTCQIQLLQLKLYQLISRTLLLAGHLVRTFPMQGNELKPEEQVSQVHLLLS